MVLSYNASFGNNQRKGKLKPRLQNTQSLNSTRNINSSTNIRFQNHSTARSNCISKQHSWLWQVNHVCTHTALFYCTYMPSCLTLWYMTTKQHLGCQAIATPSQQSEGCQDLTQCPLSRCPWWSFVWSHLAALSWRHLLLAEHCGLEQSLLIPMSMNPECHSPK